MPTRESPEKLKTKDAFDIYENGKHRRYSLLFAVNGGAFAVAKLLATEQQSRVLGGLTLAQLAVGMIAFSAVMTWDIWGFGAKMRASYLPDAFGRQGQAVLLLIGGLICAGWLLVSL